MSTHSFGIEVAAKVGVNAAVIYHNIQHWAAKNRANGKHFYEGQYWTYNSISAFEELFPYLTVSQIRTALEKLIDADYIKKGNFNQAGYDRTLWYCDLRHFHLSEIANGFAEIREPIPDINTNINKKTVSDEPDTVFEGLWATFPKTGYPSKANALKAFSKLSEADKRKCVSAARVYAAWHKGEIAKRPDCPALHLATFINQRRFDNVETAPAKPVENINWQARLNEYHKTGYWPSLYGPMPGFPGCKAPLALADSKEASH